MPRVLVNVDPFLKIERIPIRGNKTQAGIFQLGYDDRIRLEVNTWGIVHAHYERSKRPTWTWSMHDVRTYNHDADNFYLSFGSPSSPNIRLHRDQENIMLTYKYNNQYITEKICSIFELKLLNKNIALIQKEMEVLRCSSFLKAG